MHGKHRADGKCTRTCRGGGMENYRLVPLISSEELVKCVDDLALRINRDYEGKSLIVVGILKGSFIFLADLVRKLAPALTLDFVRLASYGDQSETSGIVRMTKDLEVSVHGRHVLVVEDIVDTGITLKWFLDHLQHLEPESVKVCALIDKSERRRVNLSLDYVGISLEKGFLVGYGLDYSERHRNLPAIYEVLFD